MATEATRFTCATATGKLNGQALAHEVGSIFVHSVSSLKVPDRARSGGDDQAGDKEIEEGGSPIGKG